MTFHSLKRIAAVLLAVLILAASLPASAFAFNFEYFLKVYTDPHFDLQNEPARAMTVEEYIALATAYSYWAGGSSSAPAADRSGKQPSAWCAKYVQAEVEKHTVDPQSLSWSQPCTIAYAAEFLSRSKGLYYWEFNNFYSFTGTEGLTAVQRMYLNTAADAGLIAYTPGMNVSVPILRKDMLTYQVPIDKDPVLKAPAAPNTNHMKEVGVFFPDTYGDTSLMRTYKSEMEDNFDSINMVTFYSGYLDSSSSACFTTGFSRNGQLAAVRSANEAGKLTLLAIVNYENGAFSDAAFKKVFASEGAMDQTIEAIVKEVKKDGLDGVNLALEHTASRNQYRESYSRFTEKLSAALHKENKILIATAGAYFKPEDEANSLYNYSELGKTCDYVNIILYDDFNDTGYPWRKTYGEMSDPVHVGRCLRYAASVIGPEKVQLGLSTFAIDYNTSKFTAEDIPYSLAVKRMQSAGAQLETSQKGGAFFRYTSGSDAHIVYMESLQGIKDRLAFVNRYGLNGCQIFYLGSGYIEAYKAAASNAFNPEVTTAIDAGLVPVSMRKSYDAPITRAEFCGMTIAFMESYYHSTINEILAKRGIKPEMGVFTDCSDPKVAFAKALGIVDGYGGGIFKPDKTITRREAAVMVSNLAKAVSYESKGTPMVFQDCGDQPAWAMEGINFVSSVVDPAADVRVMNGTGSGKFSPMSLYTREQTMMTLIRMLHAAK